MIASGIAANTRTARARHGFLSRRRASLGQRASARTSSDGQVLSAKREPTQQSFERHQQVEAMGKEQVVRLNNFRESDGTHS